MKKGAAKDKSIKNKIIFWVLVGVFIRLLFMPFSAHKDFLASYSRASMIVQGKATPFDFSQPLGHLLQALDLKVFEFALPPGKLPIYPEFSYPYPETFFQKEIIHRAFFLFKLPYLLCELGALLVILKLGLKKEQSVRLVKFWMLNPLLIFTFYIYGRYDSLSILMLAVTLLAIARKRYSMSALFLGISMLVRVYTVLLLPVFGLLFGKSLKDKAKLLVISLAPYALWMGLSAVCGGGSSEEWQWLASGPHQGFLFGWSFTLGQEMEIYPFFAGYFGFLIWLVLKGQSIFKDRVRDFSTLSLVVILLYLSLSFFLANYPVWLFPFIALPAVFNRDLPKLHCLQILAFLMILPYWNNPLFLRLFTAVSERAFFDFPIRGLVSLIYPAQKIVGLGRTLFSVASWYMIWLLLKDEKKTLA
ncbi:MAG: hypothetical protein ABH814_02140 [bacterium]